MPRKLRLSWIAGNKQWRKRYKKVTYYLGTGGGPNDLTAYKNALEKWEAKKVEIDKAARRSADESGYETWRNLLASRPGVDPHDYLMGAKSSSRELTEGSSDQPMPTILSSVPYGSTPAVPAKSDKLITECITDYVAYQKQRYLHGVKFPDAPQPKRISGQRFLAYQFNAALLTASWKDQQLPKSEADVAKLLIHFRNECETLLVAGKIKEGTYNERIKTLRHFAGWLHDNYLIDALPRKTDEICAKYKTKPSARSIDLDVIRKLFNAADDTLKTFIALGLNCGFYAGDISFMTAANVQGQHLRYDRHKTGVPIRYKLWPVTQELLKKHPPGKTTYFETVDGEPLLVVDVEKKQRKSKIDNKFTVLCLKLGIKKVSFSNLRDTSSTWFESDPNHRNMADLFEAHKDSSMSRFYKDSTKVDVDKLFGPLDKATDELEKYYGLSLVHQEPTATTQAAQG